MVPLESSPPLSDNPIQFSSYSPTSIKGKALEQEINALVTKGAVEQAPLPSKGYYSLFVVSKASRSWRPVSPQQICAQDSIQDRGNQVSSLFYR